MMSKKNLCLFVGYIILIIPMLFSIYNAVPASDDFAASTRLNGQSVFSQSLRYGFGMWATWGGRWLNYIIQATLQFMSLAICSTMG